MPSRTPQLRQSFLLTGVTLVLAIGFAALFDTSAPRRPQRQANEGGQDVPTRAATLVDQDQRPRA